MDLFIGFFLIHQFFVIKTNIFICVKIKYIIKRNSIHKFFVYKNNNNKIKSIYIFLFGILYKLNKVKIIKGENA